MADRAYDADERVRQRLAKDNYEAVILSTKKRNTPYPDDKELYKARHLIENFFAKLK